MLKPCLFFFSDPFFFGFKISGKFESTMASSRMRSLCLWAVLMSAFTCYVSAEAQFSNPKLSEPYKSPSTATEGLRSKSSLTLDAFLADVLLTVFDRSPTPLL